MNERAIDVFIGVTDTTSAGARLPDVTGPPILAYWNNLTADGILNNLANYSYDAAGLLPHQAGPMDRMRLMFQGTGAGADDDATMSGDLWAYSFECPLDPVGQTFQINTMSHDLYFYGTSHVITRYNSLDNIFDWIAGSGSLMHFLAGGTLSMGYDPSMYMPGLVVHGTLIINRVAGDPVATSYMNMYRNGAYLCIKKDAVLILDDVDMDMVANATGVPSIVEGEGGSFVTLQGAKMEVGGESATSGPFIFPPIEELDCSEGVVEIQSIYGLKAVQTSQIGENAFKQIDIDTQLNETHLVLFGGDMAVEENLDLAVDTVGGIGNGVLEIYPVTGSYIDIGGSLTFSGGTGGTGTIKWNRVNSVFILDTNLDIQAIDSDVSVEFFMPAGSEIIVRDDLSFTIPAGQLTLGISSSLLTLADGTAASHIIDLPSSAFILPNISWESDRGLTFRLNASAKYIMGSLIRPAGLLNKTLSFGLNAVEIRGDFFYGEPGNGLEWVLNGEENTVIDVTGDMELHYVRIVPTWGKVYINVTGTAYIYGDGNTTIRDVDASGGTRILAYWCTDGGGNTNMTFIN